MKYTVYASETIYYMKEVEAESEEQIQDLIFKGAIDFDYGDVSDGANFNVDDIIKEG